MKTSMKFEGPADLSVGNIRISGANGLLHEWMATSEQRDFTPSSIAPGYYLAEIEPAGVSPRSIVFQVQPGQANSISVPDFSFLSTTGSGTTFIGVEDREQAMKSLFGLNPDETLEASVGKNRFVPEPVANEPGPSTISPQMQIASSDIRRLSIGLSMEQAQGRESWAAFPGEVTADSSSDSVVLKVTPPSDWTSQSGRRARLTIALAGVRIERLLLPLYRGGTAIRITASQLSTSDVALEVTPLDPAIRALWRAIDAGTRTHAAAVRDQILRVKGPEPITALDAADPWEAMLAGLLFLRFPEEFGLLSADWAAALCQHHPWAADSYVIRAKQAAAAASQDPDTLIANAELAVRMLVKAQSRGSPYFTMANQFFNELVEGLDALEGLSAQARGSIDKALRRWQRELPLQRFAGTSFSWVSRDQDLLKKDGILAPKRNVSGWLRRSDTKIALNGQIKGGRIDIDPPTKQAPKQAVSQSETNHLRTRSPNQPAYDTGLPPPCPATRRKPTTPDDPNNGRFGRKARAKGFTLSARFPEDNSRMVSVHLVVEAGPSATMNLGDSVWFCLHPTFNPDWVRVFFQGRTATLTVRAWGGFTVGAWLPTQGVELELDLAETEGAPPIIRTR